MLFQWPPEELIPGFKETYTEYLLQVQKLADDFVRLFAEALGLPPDGLANFYDTPDKMQHRSKLVQYPVVNERSESDQGVGPHYDAGFVTIVGIDFDSSLKYAVDALWNSFCRPPNTQVSRSKTLPASGSMHHLNMAPSS